MEKNIAINITDNHIIHGTLCSPEEKTEKLVIFVHGFTGNKNEHIFFNGAKFLKQRGIASFRFDLYSDEKGGRSFPDCDTQTHIDDLKTVVNYLKNEYPKIYLIGHSWGGIVVLKSLINVSGIILWDSSHENYSFGDDTYKYNESLGAYLLNWGIVFVIGKKMHDETVNIDSATSLISKINSPLKIINAGNGELIDGGKEYFNLAKEPKALKVIEGASHCFDEEGAEEKLFKETADWVDKY